MIKERPLKGARLHKAILFREAEELRAKIDFRGVDAVTDASERARIRALRSERRAKKWILIEA